MMEPLRPECGSYALVLLCRERRHIRVGRLGQLETRPGYYVYVGSAFGPGGLAGRVGRHLRPAIRAHWHIDYLRPHAAVFEVWFSYDERRREHQWAEVLAGGAGAELPLDGFGASDCGCPSHLIALPSRPRVVLFRRRLRAASRGHAPVLTLKPRPMPYRASLAR